MQRGDSKNVSGIEGIGLGDGVDVVRGSSR